MIEAIPPIMMTINIGIDRIFLRFKSLQAFRKNNFILNTSISYTFSIAGAAVSVSQNSSSLAGSYAEVPKIFPSRK